MDFDLQLQRSDGLAVVEGRQIPGPAFAPCPAGCLRAIYCGYPVIRISTAGYWRETGMGDWGDFLIV